MLSVEYKACSHVKLRKSIVMLSVTYIQVYTYITYILHNYANAYFNVLKILEYLRLPFCLLFPEQ